MPSSPLAEPGSAVARRRSTVARRGYTGAIKTRQSSYFSLVVIGCEAVRRLEALCGTAYNLDVFGQPGHRRRFKYTLQRQLNLKHDAHPQNNLCRQQRVSA